MGKERFWFGAAILTLPLLALQLSLPNSTAETRGGPLDGEITIHGRPMAGGFIFLYPEDDSCAPVAAQLNNRGEFHISWRRIWRPTPETRFRITLCPALLQDGSMEDLAAIPPELKRAMESRTSDLSVDLNDQPATINIHL